MAGLIYYNNLGHIQSKVLVSPGWARFFTEKLQPFVATPPPRHLNKPLGATLELQKQAEWDRKVWNLFEE